MRFGRYDLVFNNCHHFVNRLAAMVETSECSTEGKGDDAATGFLSGIVDTLGSWWTALTDSGGEDEPLDVMSR